MVAMAWLVAVSMTVTLLVRPLKAHTVLVLGSKTIPSGLVPAGTVAMVWKVWRSKTRTLLLPPSLM